MSSTRPSRPSPIARHSTIMIITILLIVERLQGAFDIVLGFLVVLVGAAIVDLIGRVDADVVADHDGLIGPIDG